MEENTQDLNDQEKEQRVEEQKEAVKKDAKGLFVSILSFLRELLDFRDDTDRESTVEAIKKDISIKGATAWILICSIFIASVGLNANSIPVVIGAMLISPLMGPILGMGLSIAVNDIDTLRKSLINFGVMVVLSVFTAFLFFTFFPLREESSELLARTRPDIRDVLIAFFGGLALIIARTKKGTIASVIFGVAIATALMPPLCTVGFGLAVGKYGYALGAIYLFIINTIFIGLATFLVLKLLRFPMLRYANSARRKLIARIASFVAILVMIPAILTFIDVYRESKFDSQTKNFVTNEVKSNKSLMLIDWDANFKTQTLFLNFYNEITEATKSDLLNEISSNPLYPSLKDVKLKIKGSDTKSYELLSNAYKDTREELSKSRNIVEGLNAEIEELQNRIKDLETQLEEAKVTPVVGLPYSTIAKDAKIRFPDLKELGYGEVLQSNFIKVDTVKVLFPIWKFQVSDSLNQLRKDKLREWITKEMKVDTLLIK
ncbi:DUF389 domain-containing protein [Aquimarina hainanensis]|uniref:DUF389 domain-containing protein n=1 Tax=Aquimarina hainanensis TaxID=1578017 RepID=A0ABW5N9F4_9FLAO|nr:DUF389 domain-containing protein [Aquimarina sp. TRL1]QKX03802.1 DUF389 domain-containing protein [Aquimarina sp. TRL1]